MKRNTQNWTKQKPVMLLEPEHQELVELQKLVEKKTGYHVDKKEIVIKLIRTALARENGGGVI